MPFIFNYAAISSKDIQGVITGGTFCSLPAIVHDYALDFKGFSRKWGSSLATIVKRKDALVHGSVDLITEKDLAAVDSLYPSYRREKLPVRVPLTGDKFNAIVYFLDESVSSQEPTQEYLSCILKHLRLYWSGKLKSTDLYNKEEIERLKKQEELETAKFLKLEEEKKNKEKEMVSVPAPVSPEPAKRKRGRPRKNS